MSFAKINNMPNADHLKYSNGADIINTSNNSGVMFQEFCKLYRHEEILKEFEYIIENPFDGVHVFPSLKSLQVWYGVIFIRNGPYAEGIFHFKIILSDDYPYARPSIRFVSSVFHPQISPSGSFNLKHRLPCWKKCHSQVWEALKCLRECFYHLNSQCVCNDEAAHILSTNMDEFKARARGCVLVSLLEFEERETDVPNMDCETDNPFNCRLLSPRDNSILKRTFLLKKHGNTDEDLISWTKHTFEKLFNNISNYSINGLHSQSNKVPPGS